jgi:hypothetical protein
LIVIGRDSGRQSQSNKNVGCRSRDTRAVSVRRFPQGVFISAGHALFYCGTNVSVENVRNWKIAGDFSASEFAVFATFHFVAASNYAAIVKHSETRPL